MEKSETVVLASHTQREDPGKFVGKRRARVWEREARKEHQFLELSLTIRGLSG